MSSTDFFDDDLVKPRSHSADAAGTHAHGALNPAPAALTSNVTIEEAPYANDVGHGLVTGDRVVSDVDLARMAKHRDNLEGQAAKTLTEIERLKQRTDDLEHERRQLEDIRRKQDSYVNSKREMMQRLNQSLLAIEKEEVKASQLLELYSDTRLRFRSMLSNIENIDESDWPEDTMKDELSKAQDLVDSVRVECSKTLVKLDTFAVGESASFNIVDANGYVSSLPNNQTDRFAHWLKVGLALSMPLAVLMGVAGIVVYLAITQWLV